MKQVILSTLLVLAGAFGLSAQAMSIVLDTDLIQLTEGGGMPGPGGVVYREITISREGFVNARVVRYGKTFETIKNYSETKRFLGQVDDKDLQAIYQATANLTGGKFQKPSGAACEDAPLINYNVRRDEQWIQVYGYSACQTYELFDKRQRPAALAVKKYMDQWSQLFVD